MSETEEDAKWDAEWEAKRRLLCEIFGDDPDAPQPPERAINTIPLSPLAQVWPDFPAKLNDLLTRKGEHYLASTIDDLQVYDRCRCGADHCATVYTQPKPMRSYAPTLRNVVFWPGNIVNLDTGLTVSEEYPDAIMTDNMIILNVERNADGREQIMQIEALHEPDLRDHLVAALPDDED